MSTTSNADGGAEATTNQQNQADTNDEPDINRGEEVNPDQPPIDPDSSLQEVLDSIDRQLAQVDEDGEQIKQLIAELRVGNEYDKHTTKEVHQALMRTLGGLHNEHDDVRLPEIIFALWLELNRATNKLTAAIEQPTQQDAAADVNGAPSHPSPDNGDMTSEADASCGRMFQ